MLLLSVIVKNNLFTTIFFSLMALSTLVSETGNHQTQSVHTLIDELIKSELIVQYSYKIYANKYHKLSKRVYIYVYQTIILRIVV